MATRAEANKARTTHGHASRGAWTPTYRSWRYMHDRVARDPDYAHVSICARWNNFAAFLEDMGEQPPNKTLDRIDSLGDYTPQNCRWATLHEQARNRTSNALLTYQGVTKTAAEWADAAGINRKTLYSRLNYGWSVEAALTAKHRGWNKAGKVSQ